MNIKSVCVYIYCGSQQRPDSINRQMTIFYSGKAHVFDEVHPNKVFSLYAQTSL